MNTLHDYKHTDNTNGKAGMWQRHEFICTRCNRQVWVPNVLGTIRGTPANNTASCPGS